MRNWSDYLEACEQIEESSGIKSKFKEIPKISVVGCFQNGKSTFINCLLDKFIARLGVGIATTKISTRYRWGKTTELNIRSRSGELVPISIDTYLYSSEFDNICAKSAFQAEIYLNRNVLEKIYLIDTPGFNANQDDTENAIRSLEETNYAIIVLTNERTIGEAEKIMFKYIYEMNIPYAVIMNCKDKIKPFPNDDNNKAIILENEAIIKTLGYTPEKIAGQSIYPCNILWYWITTDAYSHSKHLLPYSNSLEKYVKRVFETEEITMSKINLIEESCFLPIKSFFEERFSYI